MPVQYGQYQLANSRQVKPFAGSVLPELTTVSSALQERYDKAIEQDYTNGRATRMAQAAPFESDQKILAGLKQEFNDRIQQRATRGDYENMYRDTMMDARNFMDRYQPLAENAKRLQDYKGELQQALAKGDIKDPDKMRRLLAASTQGYQGMSYDQATGQYTNKFQGLTPVKDIDPTEKIDKWMKDVAPTVLGSKTRYSDGVWMIEKGGKWTTLGPKEIQSVITAGRRLDPEFNAWMNQERLLSTTDVNNITTESFQQMKDGPVKQAIFADMQTNGSTPTQAAKNVVAAMKEHGIYQSMQQYANKYIRDDRETESGPTGADQYNLQRTGKKLEDAQDVLAMPIFQPEARTQINGAEDLLDKIKQAGIAAQTARVNFDDWVQTNQLRPDRNGQWLDAQGNNMTDKYIEHKLIYEQAQKARENLRRLEAEAAQKTGYNPGKNITPQLVTAAEKAAQEAVNNYRSGRSMAPGYVAGNAEDEKNAQQISQQAKVDYMRKNSPGYDQFHEYIKKKTEPGAQIVDVNNFDSKKVEEHATELFKGLVLNMDAAGLNSGPVGLTWAQGPKAGKPVGEEDYKQVAADAKAIGWAYDTDGQIKQYFNVGKVTQNAKGELVGQQIAVKIPAQPGIYEYLVRTKQTDPAQAVLAQGINQVLSSDPGSGRLRIGGTDKKPIEIQIERIDKTKLESGEEARPGLTVKFPLEDGTWNIKTYPGTGAAINAIKGAMQKSIQRQNK